MVRDSGKGKDDKLEKIQLINLQCKHNIFLLFSLSPITEFREYGVSELGKISLGKGFVDSKFDESVKFLCELKLNSMNFDGKIEKRIAISRRAHIRPSSHLIGCYVHSVCFRYAKERFLSRNQMPKIFVV